MQSTLKNHLVRCFDHIESDFTISVKNLLLSFIHKIVWKRNDRFLDAICILHDGVVDKDTVKSNVFLSSISILNRNGTGLEG